MLQGLMDHSKSFTVVLTLVLAGTGCGSNTSIDAAIGTDAAEGTDAFSLDAAETDDASMPEDAGNDGGAPDAPPLPRTFVYATAGANTVTTFSINDATGVPTRLGTVDTGMLPEAIAVEPVGGFVYVANRSSNDVSAFAISDATGNLSSLGTIAAGMQPNSVAVHPSGRFVYVANAASNDISVYSVSATGTLTDAGRTVAGANPFDVIVSPDGAVLYVANASDSRIGAYTIDDTTGALTPLGTPVATVASSPHDVVVDPAGDFVYVPCLFDGVPYYEVGPTGTLSNLGTVMPGDGPIAAAIDPSGRSLYVLGNTSNDVTAFSLDDVTGVPTPGAAVATGASPTGIVIESSGRFAYVTAGGGVVTFAIDATTGALTAVGTPEPLTGSLTIASVTL